VVNIFLILVLLSSNLFAAKSLKSNKPVKPVASSYTCKNYCEEWRDETKTSCESDAGEKAAGYGMLGWLVLGPVGGLIAAGAGAASGKKDCVTRVEKICNRWVCK